MAILELRGVCSGYGRGKQRKEVLRGLDAAFEAGSLTAVIGKSGAGKSTLLSLLSGLRLPDKGEVLFDGTATAKLDRNELRRRHVATIYQDFALFPLLNVTENILFPLELRHTPRKEALAEARRWAKRAQLPEELLDRRPGAISGGEQQRTAVARAFAAGAEVLLADEPTGNLDSATSEEIVSLLLAAAHEEGRCVVVVTHDMEVARRADRILRLEDGLLTEWRFG